MKHRPITAIGILLLIGVLAFNEAAWAKIGVLTEAAAFKNGVQAYLYGYPLVLMDVTRQLGTQPMAPGPHGVINQFVNIWSFPDPNFTIIVSPNADTLYSTAFLDLAQEPIVLHVPDTGGRYYLMQMMDAWTNVFASHRQAHHGYQGGRLRHPGAGLARDRAPGRQEDPGAHQYGLDSRADPVQRQGRLCRGKRHPAAI